MKIKFDEIEVDLSVEELRHFKLEKATDVKTFINELKPNKNIGFEGRPGEVKIV